MSFGFAVGDVVALGQLAWKVYRTCKDAPESFKNISQEVSSLHLVLKEVEETYSSATLSATQQSRLRSIGNGCRAVLEDLQSILDRYNSLGKSKRTWDRLGWGSNDIAELRSRLVSNTTLLTTFMNTSQVTVLKRLDVFLQEFRDGQHEGSIVSTQTIDSLSTNDRQAWRAIRKELEDIGISIAAFDANRDFIVDWFKAAVRTGAFEEESAEENRSSSILLEDGLSQSSGNTEPDTVYSQPLEDVGHDNNLKSTSVRPQTRKQSSHMRKISPKAKTQSRRPPLIAALANWWFRYNEDLIKAVESEDETEMLHALEKGAYVNTKNAKGLTPLFIAVATGNKAVLELLLNRGANIKQKDTLGYPVLHRAVLHETATSGDNTVVELLLKHGAKTNEESWIGYTALHLAAECGHERVAELLLNHGVDINKRNNRGNSALHLAAMSGHETVVQLFLKHGAKISEENMNRHTALREAIRYHRPKVEKILRDAGGSE